MATTSTHHRRRTGNTNNKTLLLAYVASITMMMATYMQRVNINCSNHHFVTVAAATAAFIVPSPATRRRRSRETRTPVDIDLHHVRVPSAFTSNILSFPTSMNRRSASSSNVNKLMFQKMIQNNVDNKNQHPYRFRLYSTSSSSSDDVNAIISNDGPQPQKQAVLLTMDHIYQEWTLEEDTYLHEHSNKNEPIYKLAAKLGRGLGGVQARLKKLKDINSAGYLRLFGGTRGAEENENNNSNKRKGLTPASEVLRRIKWDYALDPSDFIVRYYDRMEDQILSCDFSAPNASVQGKEEAFVFAIPEHRIAAVQYKQQTVWEKELRLDLVFGSMHGNGVTIDVVVAQYEEWIHTKEKAAEWNRQRQREVSQRIQLFLGKQRFAALKELSDQLRTTTTSMSQEQTTEQQSIGTSSDTTQSYVHTCYALFQEAAADELELESHSNDLHCLEMFSELVALLPDEELRELILVEILKLQTKLTGNNDTTSNNDSSGNGNMKKKSGGKQQPHSPVPTPAPLPELLETDLDETFVRGSGAGGQKVNKTSNRVVLVHLPSGLRVECQETRTLSQNRKIARKLLTKKLDIYLNGGDSRFVLKAQKQVTKKQKAKNKSKARVKKKKQEQEEQELQQQQQQDQEDQQ
jgi:uncharacterized protein (UPF0248 family)